MLENFSVGPRRSNRQLLGAYHPLQMQFPHLTAQVIGRSVDPILAAYLLAAGAPILLATLVWAWMSFLAYEKQRRDARERPGICRHCGYDLRASPGGEALFARCPECGHSVEKGRATP